MIYRFTKLKEVKTPEISLEYYPQIVYDLVFEFHNNTGNTLTIKSPAINGIIKGEGEGDGYLLCDNDIYKSGAQLYKKCYSSEIM